MSTEGHMHKKAKNKIGDKFKKKNSTEQVQEPDNNHRPFSDLSLGRNPYQFCDFSMFFKRVSKFLRKEYWNLGIILHGHPVIKFFLIGFKCLPQKGHNNQS